MKVFTHLAPLFAWRAEQQRIGLSVGFVPTMGALHPGHAALVRASLGTCDRTVCSIFVNPVQFNQSADFAHYPRTETTDQALLESVGCNVLFRPDVPTVYPAPTVLRFSFGDLDLVMEGAHRPGHFHGVALVVSRLFQYVRPDVAFFGQKDWQQFAIIRQLVADLAFPVRLVGVPTVREADGLAMSSRNVRLTPDERAIAPTLYRALEAARAAWPNGGLAAARTALDDALAPHSQIRLEYFEAAHAHSLQPLVVPAPGLPVVLCLAAHLGAVRLIDNVLVEYG